MRENLSNIIHDGFWSSNLKLSRYTTKSSWVVSGDQMYTRSIYNPTRTNMKNTCTTSQGNWWMQEHLTSIAMWQWVRKWQTLISVVKHLSLVCSTIILCWYFDPRTQTRNVHSPSLHEWWRPEFKWKVRRSLWEQTYIRTPAQQAKEMLNADNSWES